MPTLMRSGERPVRRRIPRLLLLTVHLLVSATAVLADALQESRQDVEVHVESADARTCTPVHDHLFCQLCRVIGVNAVPPVRPAGTCAPPAPRAFLAQAPSHAAPASPAAAPVGARAPPLG